MKAAVTGGHGFIGSHLVQRLLDAGHEVVVVASPWGRLDNLRTLTEHPGLEIRRGDVTDPASLADAFADVELLYHAAARVLDWGRWTAFARVNVEGTANVLAAAQAAGVRRFVHVSSVAVHAYTGFRDADPRATEMQGRVVNYARSKRMAEQLVRDAALEAVIVRPGLWPFGPRDPNFHKVVAGLRSGAFPLVGGGTSVINTAYVENLADGLVLAGTVPAAAGRTYVIADEGQPSWREVFDVLAQLIEAPRPRLTLPNWVAKGLSAVVESTWAVLPNAEPPLTRYRGALMENDVHFSIAHARDELGYVPALSWEEGLARTVAAHLGAS